MNKIIIIKTLLLAMIINDKEMIKKIKKEKQKMCEDEIEEVIFWLSDPACDKCSYENICSKGKKVPCDIYTEVATNKEMI